MLSCSKVKSELRMAKVNCPNSMKVTKVKFLKLVKLTIVNCLKLVKGHINRHFFTFRKLRKVTSKLLTFVDAKT